MAPYRVTLIPPKGDRLDLVVPFDGGKTFSILAETVILRASKHRSLPSAVRQDCLKFCLGSDDGYMIDPEDVVHDVMTATDVLFIIFLDRPATEPELNGNDLSALTGALKIRVITPGLAQAASETREIPLLEGGRYYPLSTTLSEIRHNIAQYLGIPLTPADEPVSSECNCKLAELLLKRGVWEQIHCSNHNIMGCNFIPLRGDSIASQCARCLQPLTAHDVSIDAGVCQSYLLRRTDLACEHVVHSQCLKSGREYSCPPSCYAIAPTNSSISNHFLVVFGNGQVEKLELVSNSHSAVMAKLADRFRGGLLETKAVICKGGLEVGESYSRFPVVCVCASARHQANISASSAYSRSCQSKLDLHTIEGPINTQNHQLTLQDAKLADIAVNGVLTLYALERRFEVATKKSCGLDGMFAAAPHWKLPSSQSDRGMAAFLASLRVFAHIISSGEFDDFHQNEVLRLIHALTRFPPAVRSVHILINGKTLQPNESAVLVQSIAAITENLIPLNLVGHDSQRSLEGARLVLGLILRNIRKPDPALNGDGFGQPSTSKSSLLYVSAHRTVDLRDAKTLEPVIEPVLTNLGLVNKGVFDALSLSNVMQSSPLCYLTDCSRDDPGRVRVALLYGGVALEAPYYEADAMGAAFEQYAAVQSHSLELKSLSSDIVYLASLCEETKLVVVAPRQLSNAHAPCLTLDRYGNMAVYTGRAACAEPGHDHTVFHPLTGTEQNVDVSIVAQMLEPILQARELDGTSVFDLFSATYRRKATVPTEMIVFCIDCSYSMDETSGFRDLDASDDIPVSPDTEDLLLDEEDDRDATLEEVKSWLRDHDSWEDMLHIIHHDPRNPRSVADEIIDFSRTLITRELAHLAAGQRGRHSWVTHISSRYSSTKRRMENLRRILTGLNVYDKALSDFLIFTANDPSFSSKDCHWTWGVALPVPSTSAADQEIVELGDFCEIPEDFTCPISQVVFEDPVITSDGFTFDRKAIERWYRMRRTSPTSPLTGLPITDITLRHQAVLATRIKSWCGAEDVIQSLPSTPKRTRLAKRDSHPRIDFIAPTVRFSRDIPGSATLLDLYKIAFRGMRGCYTSFSLYLGNVHLPCTTECMRIPGVTGHSTITIRPSHVTDTSASSRQQEMCLIRVFSRANTSTPHFEYWIPLHSELTMASILFRNWRYCVQQSLGRYRSYDRAVWTSLEDAGDGVYVGYEKHSWSSLSDVARDLPRVEIQEHDSLFEPLRAKHTDNEASSARTREISAPRSQPLSYEPSRVLKVQLCDYRSPEDHEQDKLRKQRQLSRMAVTKQVFSQFINRLIAYNYPTNVGLVTFGSKAQISQKVTDVIENFRQAVDKMKVGGDTALWDALMLAEDHLMEASRNFPNIKKRIVCLSDGKDTTSAKSAENICGALIQHGIVVDSVCIGDEDNLELRTVSSVTGGYKFVPSSVEEASALCELEPVLSIHERPPISRRMLRTSFHSLVPPLHVRPDPVTRDVYPARKVHENLHDTFIRIGQFERTAASRLPTASAGTVWSSARSRRLLQEIQDIANHPHPSYDVYLSERNMGFWKVALQGPNESAYASGAFLFYLDMGEEYPRKPPSGRFITPVFHPNVNRHGRIW